MQQSRQQLFEWAEEERALASELSNAELAQYLLDDVYQSVCTAEQGRGLTDEEHALYKREYGAIREAAYRLAGIREHEADSNDQDQPSEQE